MQEAPPSTSPGVPLSSAPCWFWAGVTLEGSPRCLVSLEVAWAKVLVQNLYALDSPRGRCPRSLASSSLRFFSWSRRCSSFCRLSVSSAAALTLAENLVVSSTLPKPGGGDGTAALDFHWSRPGLGPRALLVEPCSEEAVIPKLSARTASSSERGYL